MHEIVAVPILKHANKIGVAKGKHWSVVEHVVLDLLSAKPYSLPELSDETSLPDSLLVEILTQLMRAGWVSLIGDSKAIRFTGNEIGKALASYSQLPAITKPETRWVSYVVELLTGKIIRSSRVSTMVRENELSARIKRPFCKFDFPNEYSNDIIAPQDFQDNLLNADEELTSIEVNPHRPSRRFMILEASNNKIRGVDQGLGEKFNSKIFEAVRAKHQHVDRPLQFGTTMPETRHIPKRSHRVHVKNADLICGSSPHRDAFHRAITKCRRRLIIHSTFIGNYKQQEILSQLHPAISRGVKIDILWGQDTLGDETNSTLAAAQSLAQALKSIANPELVRVSNETSGSHSKFLIYDTGTSGGYEAVIGSCNWLSSNFDSFEASFRTSSNGFVADLCRVVSALSVRRSGDITNLAIEMNRLAMQLDATATNTGDGTLELVFGSEHNDTLLVARDDATNEISILSHRLGIMKGPTFAALSAATKAGNVKANVFYGRHSGGVSGSAASGDQLDLQKHGIKVAPVHRPRLHAKALTWDNDNLVITSLNWLSADVPDECRFQEIGVHIKQKNIAKHFNEMFHTAKEFGG